MINVSDLKKRLSVEILPVYFLKGQDAYVKELAIGVLKGFLDKDFADMNLTVLRIRRIWRQSCKRSIPCPFRRKTACRREVDGRA